MENANISKLPHYGNRFSEMKKLGSGTYGDVFRGYDQELQRYVAVKKFKDMSDGNLGINMLIMREISFLRQLNHPNVIKSLDVLMGKKFDNILVIMEVEDTDLFCFMEESVGMITLPTIRFITKQIISACAYLHSNYVMHRDLKPDNILICRKTKVIKVSDLGFARIFTHAITTSARPANYTFPIQAKYYRAPEVLLGSAEYSYKVDIWSIGCMLGDLLCGDRQLFTMPQKDRYKTDNESSEDGMGGGGWKKRKKGTTDKNDGRGGDSFDREDEEVGDRMDSKDRKIDDLIDKKNDTLGDKTDKMDEKKKFQASSSSQKANSTDIASLHSIFQLLGYPTDTYASQLRLLPNYNLFLLSPTNALNRSLNHSSRKKSIIADIMLAMEPRLRSPSAAQLLLKLLWLEPTDRTDLYSIIDKDEFFSE